MRRQKLFAVMAGFFCLGAGWANAQYYTYPPEGVGPYFRAGIGPTFYQTGTLREYEGAAPFFSGPANEPVTYDTGFSFDGAIGYSFNRYVGLDFETGYVWGRIDNIPGYYANGSTIGNVPFMGNVTLSLPIPHTIVVPYIGGGVGGSDSIFDARDFQDQGGNVILDGNESDTVFAYQLFAGVRFMLAPNFSLGIAYKYFATGNPTYSFPGPGPNLNVGFDGVRTHSVLFTLRCDFW